MSRNQNHELVMQAIYVELTNIEMKQEINIPSIMEGVYKLPFNKIDIFSREIVVKTTEHINEMIQVIDKALSKSWRWDRIARLAQAILLMSYAHYHYVEKVDKAIVIEIAVKLSKKYLDVNEHKFINAVLDKIL